MLERLKQSSVSGLIAIKVNTDLLRKQKRMSHKIVFIYTLFNIVTKVLMIDKSLEKCETNIQLKDR